MAKLSVAAIQEINRLHDEIWEGARTSIEKAIRIGELLAKQKALLEHGGWMPWLKENVQFSHPTAWRYMRIYERREEVKYFSVKYLTGVFALLVEPHVPEEEQVTAPEPINEPKPNTAKAVTNESKSEPQKDDDLSSPDNVWREDEDQEPWPSEPPKRPQEIHPKTDVSVETRKPIIAEVEIVPQAQIPSLLKRWRNLILKMQRSLWSRPCKAC
jgi:hypothetical protein